MMPCWFTMKNKHPHLKNEVWRLNFSSTLRDGSDILSFANRQRPIASYAARKLWISEDPGSIQNSDVLEKSELSELPPGWSKDSSKLNISVHNSGNLAWSMVLNYHIVAFLGKNTKVFQKVRIYNHLSSLLHRFISKTRRFFKKSGSIITFVLYFTGLFLGDNY